MESDRLVTLWTYQLLENWRTLQIMGRLRMDEAHRARIDPYFIEPYEWMREEMRKRIVGYGGAWPIWAWARKPTTLWHALHEWPLGTPFVRIKFRIDAARILCSDFVEWHCPLNRGPVLFTDAEEKIWDVRSSSYDETSEDERAEMRVTWERIFDLNACVRAPLLDDDDAGHQIVQAVIEEIRREDVIRVIPCIGLQWPPRMLERNRSF